MKRTKVVQHVVCLCVLVGIAGCEKRQLNPEPRTVRDYKTMSSRDRRRHPDALIQSVSLARVQNDELSTQRRLDALALYAYLGQADDDAVRELRMVASDPRQPKKVRLAIAAYLKEKGYAQGVASSSEPADAKGLSKSLSLAEVVVQWAPLPKTGPNERAYRTWVKENTGTDWDRALLNALNTPRFTAPVEAMDVLQKRVNANTLKRQILALKPATSAIKSLQAFAKAFDYIPTTPAAFMQVLVLYHSRRDMFSETALRAAQWQEGGKYKFRVRDFHLLSRLSRDPRRDDLKQPQLVVAVGKVLKKQRHISRDGKTDQFWAVLDQLDHADLWNIYLLHEMLSRPRVQMKLRLMMNSDQADTGGEWGGLVFYQSGQAEAHLYRYDKHAPRNDQAYQPSRRVISDGRDALCRFVSHAHVVKNKDLGPTATELRNAKTGDFNGLTLSRTDKDHFAAYYYTPNGAVVSLGVFPLR